MLSFTNTEFLTWAKAKGLTFVVQAHWPDAYKLLPADEVATKLSDDRLCYGNLYTNAKKELFLAIYLAPSTNQADAIVLVFKQLTALK